MSISEGRTDVSSARGLARSSLRIDVSQMASWIDMIMSAYWILASDVEAIFAVSVAVG